MTGEQIAVMTAHEFRRHFPAIDRCRRLLKMPWAEYREQLLWSMGHYRMVGYSATSTGPGEWESRTP